MSNINFVFWGTDDFSVIVLDEFKKAGLLPALVVTQPDRPKGRGLVLTPPPIKRWAIENGIECFQPVSLDPSASYQLRAKSYQLFVVASYGHIIPKHILDIPKHGTLNVHPSLLPKYRGATPIESQILNGEKEVGVTIMQMDEKMDHGSILAQKKLVLEKVLYANELQSALAHEGGELLAEVMPMCASGKIEAMPQDHSKATYTKKFTKADGEIDLSGDPYKNFLKIQAFDDSIGTYFFVSGSPFGKGSTRPTFSEKLGGEGFKSSLRASSPRALAASKDLGSSFYKGGIKRIRVLIKSAEYKDGNLVITRVVPEGKKEMSYEEFLRGME